MKEPHSSPDSRQLLIVGASARAAAAAAKREGFLPSAIDLFADLDLTELAPVVAISRFPEQLENAAGRFAPMNWLYTGGLENYPTSIRLISQRHTLLGNGPEVLAKVRDPFYLQRAASDCGFAFPQVARRCPGSGWLRKPFRSAAGKQIREMTRAVAEQPCDRYYFQKVVGGSAVGANFLGNGRQAKLLGLTRQLSGPQWPGTHRFQYVGSIGPLAVNDLVSRQVEALGNILAHHCGLVGIFGLDVLVDDSTIWLVEVNPRYTASAEVLELGGGLNSISAHLRACLHGELPTDSCCQTQMSGKLILFARKKVRLSETAWQRLCVQCDGDSAISIADIPHPGTEFDTGQPLLTLLTSGNSEAEVVQKLRRYDKQLRAVLNC